MHIPEFHRSRPKNPELDRFPYGKAVSLRISCEYLANNWRTALFAVIVRNIFTSCREYPANKTGQSKK